MSVNEKLTTVILVLVVAAIWCAVWGLFSNWICGIAYNAIAQGMIDYDLLGRFQLMDLSMWLCGTVSCTILTYVFAFTSKGR